METYLKLFTRELIENKDNLNGYIDTLYEDKNKSEEIGLLLSELEKEGLLSCKYADNRIYDVQFTLRGKNLAQSELKLTDKEELLMLIRSIKDIENLFYVPDSEWSFEEQIYDIPRFQEWIQQVIMYLQEIFDRTHDQFILGTINSCQVRMNGSDDRIQFNEIVGKLKGIEKNIDKYYQNGSLESQEKIMQTKKKIPMIFISHSHSDKKHVELIVKLLKDMGFNQDMVFCSSVAGYGIGLSRDIYDTLLKLFENHDLYVIFVHSPNYYDSAVGLNEMGAAWVLKSSFCSILLPGFEYTDMKGVVDSNKISIKIDSDRRTVQNLLNELYDDLAKFFSISRNTSIIWENARDEFIDKMNAVNVISESRLTEEAESILREAEKDDKGEVLIAYNLEGMVIQAGHKSMNKPGIRREEALMEGAVRELIRKGFLIQKNKNLFVITDLGYKYLDS